MVFEPELEGLQAQIAGYLGPASQVRPGAL